MYVYACICTYYIDSPQNGNTQRDRDKEIGR